MNKLRLKRLYSLVFLFLSLTLSGCGYYHEALVRPSSWAGMLVIAAILVFFYYLIKMFRRK